MCVCVCVCVCVSEILSTNLYLNNKQDKHQFTDIDR